MVITIGEKYYEIIKKLNDIYSKNDIKIDDDNIKNNIKFVSNYIKESLNDTDKSLKLYSYMKEGFLDLLLFTRDYINDNTQFIDELNSFLNDKTNFHL